MEKPFRMYCWAGEEGDVNAYGFQLWERMNPSQGVYSWDWFDKWLDDQKSRGRKTAFSIACHISSLQGWNGRFYDGTPEWVYGTTASFEWMNGRRVGKVVAWTDNNSEPPVTYYSALPLYSDANWQKAFKTFTLAFAVRYDNDPRLDYVHFGPGLDMETQPSKSPFPDGGMAYRFSQLCEMYPAWYKQGFMQKPLFYACLPGQSRMKLTKICQQLGIGVKSNGGFITDIDSWDGYGMDKSTGAMVHYSPENGNYSGLFWGLWDHLSYCNANNIPVWIESAYGWASPEERYWSIPAVLSYHPVNVDIHSGLLAEMTPDEISFIRDHTNVTAETTPSVWIVMRDFEFPLQTWSQKNSLGIYEPVGCSGKIGDHEFYLTMEGDAPRVKTNNAPKESRQYRLLNQVTLYVDENFQKPPYEVWITWLQNDKTLTVEYYDTSDNIVSHSFSSDSTNTWKITKTKVTDRSFVIRGGAAVHMIQCIPTEPDVEEPDMDVIAESIDMCELALSDATKWLINANSELANAQREAVAAKTSLVDATTAVEKTNFRVDQARANQRDAQCQINAANEELAKIRAELEKA